MKKLISRFASWWLMDLLTEKIRLQNTNSDLMDHMIEQNELIRRQGKEIQYNHLQIERLRKDMYGGGYNGTSSRRNKL